MALQISDTTPRVQYTATSGQTSFSVPFEFFAVADLKVYNGTTLLTYSTSPSSASQYSVTGAGVTGGGSITLGSPGATLNDVITIVRDLAIERLSDFPVSGNFPIQTLNSELDKIVAMLQQLEEQFARTLQYPVTTTTGFDVDLPELVANRVLSVNADATALLAEQELGTFKGDWAASTSYQVRDLVKDTSNGNIYFVNAAHTSSGSEPLSSNTNSSKYDLIVDAESATTSATNAATSATAAASSATAAATSETNAATSETNAATSESNASTSETNASTSATNASNSATAAATSATNAATSESNASTSETNASTSATNAASSATSAAGSATTATTQASAASTSASNAATSESNAATSASNASTSETNAATSATNASNAQTAAETAQAAAEAAADSIDDTYLGAKASNPTVDNDGDPLTVGDWYFNTTSNQTFIYNGSSWDAIAPDLIGDATPQLGGDLDLNSNDITGTGNINITGNITASGNLVVDTNTLFVDSVNNIVRIGDNHSYSANTSADELVIGNTTAGSKTGLTILSSNDVAFSRGDIYFADVDNNSIGRIEYNHGTSDTDVMKFYTNSTEAMRIDSSGNVGIGESNPDTRLYINSGTANTNTRFVSTDVSVLIQFKDDTGSSQISSTGGDFRFGTSGDASFAGISEAMRIDSSQNLIVGKTSVDLGVAGVEFRKDSYNAITRDGGVPLYINRLTSDGGILEFRKDNATVGSIGASFSRPYFANDTIGIKLGSITDLRPTNSSGTNNDNAIDLGVSSVRFRHLYLGGSVYLGGTTSANALDDYEEGTFTVTYSPQTSGSVTLQSGENELSYVKIGRMVHVQGRLRVDSVSSPVGNGNIFSLPFVVGNFTDRAEEFIGVVSFFGLSSSTAVTCTVRADASQTKMIINADDGVSENFNSNKLQANSGCRLSLTYMTN